MDPSGRESGQSLPKESLPPGPRLSGSVFPLHDKTSRPSGLLS